MKKSHIGIVILVVLCASLWVVVARPIFSGSEALQNVPFAERMMRDSTPNFYF